MNSKRRLSITLFIGIMLIVTGIMNSNTLHARAAVRISSTKVILIKGQKKNLDIKGTGRKVKWSSSSTKVAAVSQRGTVTAKGKGQAVIYGKVSNKTYRCRINVEEPKLNKRELKLKKNQTVRLKLTQTSGKIVWKSDKKSVASVSKYGLVRAVAAGRSAVSATVRGKKYSCKVSVSKEDINPPKIVKPTSITLNKKEVSLLNGTYAQLSAKVNPSNTTDKRLSWRSSNVKIVSVDQNGKIQAKSPGTAVISVTCQGVSASCTVTVTPEQPNISIRLYVGAGFQTPTGILDVRIQNKGKKPLKVNKMIVLKTGLEQSNLYLRLYGEFIPDYTVGANTNGFVQVCRYNYDNFMVDMRSKFLFNITYDGVTYNGEADYYGEEITLTRAGNLGF